jgi:hypothetical protein
MDIEKFKNIAVIALTALMLYGLLIINLFKPASEVSYSERRKLAQFPELSAESIWSADFFEGFDSYAVDQTAFREDFRSLKAFVDINVLRRSDNNGIFIVGDMIFKMEYPLNEKSVIYLCDRINYVYDKYLNGAMNVRYTMVPDKNYYIENPANLVLDYHKMEDIIRANIGGNIEYLDLKSGLTLDDYYLTDAHWRQEKLEDVVKLIADGYGADIEEDGYTQESFSPFYGVYYGQAALNVQPDEIIYLTNPAIENAVVTNVERPGETLGVYDRTELGGMDSYNLFMEGPSAVVTAENPLNTSGRELIIFRDSYASSLSPLLLDGYERITLIDLRYIHPDLIGDYVSFDSQDVLFMYSATLFNNSGSIK